MKKQIKHLHPDRYVRVVWDGGFLSAPAGLLAREGLGELEVDDVVCCNLDEVAQRKHKDALERFYYRTEVDA
jgi:hypothetical protein